LLFLSRLRDDDDDDDDDDDEYEYEYEYEYDEYEPDDDDDEDDEDESSSSTRTKGCSGTVLRCSRRPSVRRPRPIVVKKLMAKRVLRGLSRGKRPA
jgi:hypothetical protein